MFRFTMFRFRRYRVFLICAFLITVALVRFYRNRDWEGGVVFGGLYDGKRVGHFDPAKDPSPLKSDTSSPIVDIGHLAHSSKLPTTSKLASKEDDLLQKSSVVPASKSQATLAPTNASPKTIPEAFIPNREPAPVAALYDEDDDTEVYMQSPGRVEPIIFTPSPTPIHWVKQQEHFPVPTESIIQLPTGEVKPMPRIQHIFSEETIDAKNNREMRQRKVKDEFTRAWNGYKKNAWMHDELSPVSGGSRDPFGGWAATLVDSLDTLWIMGLEEEFAEAVNAVADIDFTTCARPDIPLFETTIRYMGGLLGAYDVSGNTYKTLLEKAVELGEVLMGAFDTPNRMPNLYYRWNPTFASQPHRASLSSVVSELGTLTMEFTRLAQLTKESKYYDAVARITNALEEFQNRGTKLGGIFPNIVDASGCNHSASIDSHSPTTNGTSMSLNNSLSAEGKGYEVPMPKVAKEPRPSKRKGSGQAADLEFSVIPGEPSKGHLRVMKDEPDNSKGEVKILKRRESETVLSNSTAKGEQDATENSSVTGSLPATPLKEVPDSVSASWDCLPQGLDSASGSSGYDSFAMGALQDSTYEYFSKQYLLLGGLEDKYRTMYLKAIDTIRKYLLYRPMIPNNRNILFSGRATTAGNPDIDLSFDAEVTHLTCFLGGMVGMGAKLFGIDTDLEIAKKLSDGCVWAYESMKSGIMPETATVIACKNVTDCPWNKTMWLKALDPLADQRDQMVKDYESKKAKLEAQQEASRLAEESGLTAETAETSEAAEADTDADLESLSPADNDGAPRKDSTPSLRRRDIRKGSQNPATQDLGDYPSSKSKSSEPSFEHEDRFQKKLKDTEDELLLAAPSREVKSPPPKAPQVPLLNKTVDPDRPLTHEEYIKHRLEREGITPGFVQITSDKYILRPEAIESVWYMYRITGDPAWQDKGWVMFEHIINATQTTHGHTAITSVTTDSPEQTDEMESFWLAETLKYFYLLYSTPDVISLDEWVLNTEAHPFKRPK